MGRRVASAPQQDRSTFENFLEHVLSIASTTFYSMPSSELLSAATETFYDIAPNTFRWAEKKLLLETIHSSHHLKTVAMSVTRLSTGSSIVRVETRNMTRELACSTAQRVLSIVGMHSLLSAWQRDAVRATFSHAQCCV